jgi:hypothetical protein
MNSRERVRKAINHQETDRIPLDLGSTLVTGIYASTYTNLRRALGLKDQPVRIVDPFQMLAEVEMEVIEKLEIDTIGLWLPTNFFGFRNENWKPWKLFDGTKVMVPEKFNTKRDDKGNLYLYPKGDMSVPPCAKMPQGGYYFDLLVRQEPLDKKNLNPEEWAKQQYSIFSEETLKYLENKADELYKSTDLSIIGEFIDAGFGDISMVPGPTIKNPKGIRDPERWIIAHIEYPDYIKEIFELQCEIALKNLKLSYEAVGNKIDVMMVSGTDFGTQNAPFISPDNPVQASAKDMDPRMLKERYGDKLVFWGGGVDTQRTLPFGTPEEVRKEVNERCEIFGKGGGFVFNTIHNIQAKVPIENLVAMLQSIREFRF